MLPFRDNLVLVIQTSSDPHLRNAASTPVDANQLFSFRFEDMVDSIKYDLKAGNIISSTPVELARQTVDNRYSTDK